MLTQTLPLAFAAAMSALEAAGVAEVVFADFAGAAMEFDAGALDAGFAAGAAMEFDAGALAAGFAAGAAMEFDAGALDAALASAFLLFFDFFAAVADVSVLAAVLSLVAVLSLAAVLSAAAASFLLFFDFFVVVVVVLLSVVLVALVWAAANTGIKARLNTKDKIAVHRVNLFRELLIFLISSHGKRRYAPYFSITFLKPIFSRKVALETQETLHRRSQWVNQK